MTDEEKIITRPKGNFGRGILKLLSYLLILAIGAGSGILAARLRPDLFGLAKGQAQVQAETESLISKVGKLINLPADEKPTVATVTDESKIKDQVFFQKAQNGDIVLIYTNSQKAILYRPSENKIIEVGTVNNQTGTLPTPTVSKSK